MLNSAEKGRKEVKKMEKNKYLENLYREKEMYQIILNNSFRVDRVILERAEELMPEIDERIEEYKKFLKQIKERG